MEVTGIVIAGGKSSRMGNDKGFMLHKNKPLVTYPLEALKQVCANIIISTNNNNYNKFGYPLIQDEIKNIGPIGGIFSSLKASKNEWNLVLACDMPFVSPEFLNSLLSEIDNRYDAVVPKGKNNQFETLCAAYSKKCISRIEQQVVTKKYGIHQLLKSLKLKTIPVSENNRNFINLNTLDEFKRAEKNIY